MIKLDPIFQTVATSTFNGVTSTQITDTLFIQEVRIDFTTGAIYATVQKGTGTPFQQTLDAIQICVNPDGTFVSSDNLWVGLVASAPALVAQLKATFDQFILSSGKVTGTEI
jgi:hypothetical protein